MSPQTVSTLFGLALLAALPTVAVAAAVPSFRPHLTRFGLVLGAAVAIGATAGSLYFSEIADFVPCRLCWFQRIAMYPLALVLAMAAVRRDRGVLLYVSTISALGLVVSGYHVSIQWFPETSNFCEFTNPCSAKWVEAFGWLTIPQMAGLSFILILIVSITTMRSEVSPSTTDD
jgi:disulfide bond formation protein DsbB